MVSQEFIQELEDRLIQKRTELHFAQEDLTTATGAKKDELHRKIREFEREIKETEAQLAAAKGEAKTAARVETVKKIGKGAAKAAGKAVSAAATGVGDVLNTKVSVNVEPMPWLFFFVALIIHLYDALSVSSFDRSAGHATIMIILYLFFTLFYILFCKKSGFTTESGTYFGISLSPSSCHTFSIRISPM